MFNVCFTARPHATSCANQVRTDYLLAFWFGRERLIVTLGLKLRFIFVQKHMGSCRPAPRPRCRPAAHLCSLELTSRGSRKHGWWVGSRGQGLTLPWAQQPQDTSGAGLSPVAPSRPLSPAAEGPVSSRAHPFVKQSKVPLSQSAGSRKQLQTARHARPPLSGNGGVLKNHVQFAALAASGAVRILSWAPEHQPSTGAHVGPTAGPSP